MNTKKVKIELNVDEDLKLAYIDISVNGKHVSLMEDGAYKYIELLEDLVQELHKNNEVWMNTYE